MAMPHVLRSWMFPCLLLYSVLTNALPQLALIRPRGSGPPPLVNVTAETPISGNVTIMTSLLFLEDACTDDEKTQVNQAFIDALNIIGTVGGIWGPQYMFNPNPVLPDPIPPWDYFGAKSKYTQAEQDQIINNILSAQAPNDHWQVGDWWKDRHFSIACNDPGDKNGHNCGTNGASGYEVEPSLRVDDGAYPLINFCTGFFALESLAARVEHVNNGDFGFDPNDVRTLVSQGQDVSVRGYPGKAYGPARAKHLARLELGGPSATSLNVDNYVFYAVSWYMYNQFDVVPQLPKYDWSRLSAAEHYPSDSEPQGDDDDSTLIIDGGALMDDADFYAGTGFTPSGGDKPAAATGPSSNTDTVPMPTSAPPSATSAPPPPPPPYAAGTCSFHLTETQDCTDDSSNLFAIVNLLDNNKADIGDTAVNDSAPIGVGINTSNPYQFTSKLPNPLVITGEHENDYVQFVYGSLSWTSRDTTGSATCSNGGWDPKDGPVCGLRTGNQNAVNNMDCSFPC